MSKGMNSSRRANRTVLFRTFILMALFGVATFVALGVKLYQIQIVEHDFYEQRAVQQQTRDTVISPIRGSILDRNLKPLAVSASVETIFIAPVEIEDDKEAVLISKGLSELLDVDYDDVYAKTQKAKRAYEVIKKKVEKDVADKVRAFVTEHKLQASVHIVPDYKRYYPNGNFASHVLGFVGEDSQGLDGVEKVYDENLKGTPGRIITAKDGKGVTMPFQFEKYYDAQDGLNAVLTIDETMQLFLEKHLKTALVENQVKNRAAGIIMDVKTGEILAMDTQNGYDPNQPRVITDEALLAEIAGLEGEAKTEAQKNALYAQWRNKIVVDTYEPGSTFKIITTAIALEEKAVALDDQFYCKGSIMVPGWGKPINCHKRAGHGAETFLQGVQNSCNPVFITVAQRVGREKFYQYFKAFGFTEKTGVDIPGESSSVFHSWKAFNQNDVTLSTYAFGQTFNITPIQLITAVSAVANGGNLMKPHIVKEFTDEKHNIVETVEPQVVRQVISGETSKQVCEILETVVSKGTGQNAYVAGYRIGGKTGTSQKRDPATNQYMSGKYVVSFVGFAPADNPQIAVLILLDEPMYGPPNLRTGGGMAAPVVGRIMADVLPYLQIEQYFAEEEPQSSEISIPMVTDLSVGDATKLLDEKKIKYKIKGEGETVTQQVPAAGARVPANAEIVLYVGHQTKVDTVIVPNLLDLTAEQVNKRVTDAGLYLRAVGATAADGVGIKSARQDIAEGTEVALGTVVEVEFRNMDLRD